MRIFAAIVIALVPLPAVAQVAPTSPDSEVVATGQDSALRLTVPVRINGQGPFDFVIDTGADRTVISEELAERLALPAAGTAKLHAMGGSGTVDIVEIATVELSNRKAKNVRAAALPARYIGADGLLGIDSLKGQRVEMDFEAKTMRVVPSDEPERAVPAESDLIIVTARTRLGQLVMVDADANGQKIHVVVDTGAQNTVGNSKLQRILSKRVKGTVVKPIDMIDVLGKRTAAQYTIVDRVRIGGVAMGNTAVAFADAHPFKLFGLSNKPSMLLGIETLKSFKRVSVDFTTKKIKFLLPPPSSVSAAQK
jgi:predicted aspartyl protease